MEPRQLAYFLAVVDHGGVTAAAAAVHVAQPSLSQAIRGLENELGVALFHREGRGLTPTASGMALVEPARRVLRSQVEARRAVADVLALHTGWLDVAAHDLLAVDPLAGVLGPFHRAHPGVAVRLHSPRDEDEMAGLLLDGRCELALTYLPVTARGLRIRRLGRQEVWVVLPPGGPAYPDPLPVADLDGAPVVIGIEGHAAVRDAVRAGLRDAGARMRPSVTTRHREAVVPLVLAGAGAAFVNGWYAAAAAGQGAQARRLDPPIECAFGVVYRGSGLSSAAAALLAALGEDTPTG